MGHEIPEISEQCFSNFPSIIWLDILAANASIFTYVKIIINIPDTNIPAWCLKCQDPGSRSQKICQFPLVTSSLNVQKGREST